MANRTLPSNTSLSQHLPPNGVTLKVKSSSHAITVHSDGGCFDTVSGVNVNVEDTNAHDPTK